MFRYSVTGMTGSSVNIKTTSRSYPEDTCYCDGRLVDIPQDVSDLIRCHCDFKAAGMICTLRLTQ